MIMLGTSSAWRKKLLKLMPRQVLEELSRIESPWHATRRDLEEAALKYLTNDDVEEFIAGLRERCISL